MNFNVRSSTIHFSFQIQHWWIRWWCYIMEKTEKNSYGLIESESTSNMVIIIFFLFIIPGEFNQWDWEFNGWDLIRISALASVSPESRLHNKTCVEVAHLESEPRAEQSRTRKESQKTILALLRKLVKCTPELSIQSWQGGGTSPAALSCTGQGQPTGLNAPELLGCTCEAGRQCPVSVLRRPRRSVAGAWGQVMSGCSYTEPVKV